MAAFTYATIPSQVTNAQFRAWGGNVSASMANVGWTKASDSGQIDFTTVACPTVNNSSQGFEIWKMTDSLASTAPVCLKIEYGSGSGVAASNALPALWLTIAANSNGSGGLLGIVSPRFQIIASNTTNVIMNYASGNTSRIAMGLWGSPNGNTSSGIAVFFSIERTKDASGNDTSDGVMTLIRDPGHGTPAFRSHYWNTQSGTQAPEDWGLLMPTPNTANVSDSRTMANTAAVYPIYFSKAGTYLNPGFNVLGFQQFYHPVQVDVPITINYYGTNHTYMPFHQNIMGGATGGFGGRQSANASFMMLYE